MHLILDPKNIADRPREFSQLMRGPDEQVTQQRMTKRQDEERVRYFLQSYLIRPRRCLIIRRWAYVGQQTAEYILRPDPTVLCAAGESSPLALVCRFNPTTKLLEVHRSASISGEAVFELEQIYEGDLDLSNAAESDEEAIAFLAALPESGTDLAEPLRQWSKYLVWRQKLAEDKAKEAYAYSEREIDERTKTVVFYLKNPDVLEKLKLRFAGESLRVTPTEDARAKGVFQGEFRRIIVPGKKAPVRGQGNYHLRRNGDPVATPEKLSVTLAMDLSSADNLPSLDTTIPEEGFLRLAMEGELSAVDVQQNGLQRLAEHRGLNPSLRDWLFDIRRARAIGTLSSDWVPDGELNNRQRECVAKALAMEDLLLLWGPPGTGKTSVIAEITSQYCRRDRRVLISSQANLAVDQALEKLPLKFHIRPARVSTSKKKDGLAVNARFWIQRWFSAIAAESETAAQRESDPRWKALLADWSNHVRSVDAAEGSEDFERHYLRRANVVGATCLETGKPEFRSGVRFIARFDLTIVDEVSKATPPEVLLPALMGSRTLLVGDHRQLPPVFKDSTFPEALENKELTGQDFEAFRGMVTTSFFEGYFRGCDPSVRCGLDEQYRMHPHIMRAVNFFYADQPLRAGGGEDKRSTERSHNLRLFSPDRRPWLFPGKHLVWIDTAHDEHGQPVSDERVGTSRCNRTEARVCAHLLQDLLHVRLSVAVISFYRAQIQALGQHLSSTGDRTLQAFVDSKGVNTVDQFQGSERDVVIVSLTRTDCPLTGEFVSDFRRINVALSRAKKLLIVLGSARTFDSGLVTLPSTKPGQDEAVYAYKKIRELAARLGVVRRVQEILPAPQFNQWQHRPQSR